jgi:hypothetical protein
MDGDTETLETWSNEVTGKTLPGICLINDKIVTRAGGYVQGPTSLTATETEETMSRTTNRLAVIAVATVALYVSMLALSSTPTPALAAASVPCMDLVQGIVTALPGLSERLQGVTPALAGGLPPSPSGPLVVAELENASPLGPPAPVASYVENTSPPALATPDRLLDAASQNVTSSTSPAPGVPVVGGVGDVVSSSVVPVVAAPISTEGGSVLPGVSPVLGVPAGGVSEAANVGTASPAAVPVLGVQSQQILKVSRRPCQAFQRRSAVPLRLASCSLYRAQPRVSPSSCRC